MPETAQPPPEPEAKHSRGLGSYVLWAFVALMVYVLSSGPVMKLAAGPSAMEIIYYPLYYAYFMISPLHKPLGLYWHLWLPGAYDKEGEIIPIPW